MLGWPQLKHNRAAHTHQNKQPPTHSHSQNCLLTILGGDAREAAAINGMAGRMRAELGVQVFLLNPPGEAATPELRAQMLAAMQALEQEKRAPPHPAPGA